MVYTQGTTQAKYHINTGNFPQGFVTPDDSWSNRWRQGPNQVLGWIAIAAGQRQRRQVPGHRNSAQQQAFAQCQAQKVFQAVCYRAPPARPTCNQVSRA